MKTFTATQLNKSPQEIFAAAKEDGFVLIIHDRYEKSFAITHNPYDFSTMVDLLNAMFDAHEEYGCGFYDYEPWTTHYDKLRNMLGRDDHFTHD